MQILWKATSNPLVEPYSSSGEFSPLWQQGKETSFFFFFNYGYDSKNPPAMWETQVQCLGWEDSLQEGMVVAHSSFLAWRIPMDRGACVVSPWGLKESDMAEQLTTVQHMFLKVFGQWSLKQSLQSVSSIWISSSLGHFLSLVGSSESFPFVLESVPLITLGPVCITS